MMAFGGIFSAWPSSIHPLLSGLVVSAEIAVLSLAWGIPLGMCLGLLTNSRRRSRWLVGIVIVEVGRGIPALVMLELVYFGMPQIHVTLGSDVAAVIALGITAGAYYSEGFRSSFIAVPASQREAAEALAMSPRDTFFHVVLPQAMRVALPPGLSLAIGMLQATSLAFAIAVPEMMSKAYELGSQNFEYLSVFVLVGCLYAALCLPGSYLAGRLERKLSVDTNHQ